jgi:hypothetical protein
MASEPVPVPYGPRFGPSDAAKALGYDLARPETQVLIAIANRYRLDPLIRQIELIPTRNGLRPYISRDGYLEIAHRSGKLDGIVVDEERRNSTGDGYTAYVTVYRNDMSHGFRYGAQCKDSEPQAKNGNGPEMALARAERRALMRAFNIPDPTDNGDDLETVTPDWDTGPPETPVEADVQEDRGQPSSLDPGDVRLDGYPLTGQLIPDKDWLTERVRRAGTTPARTLTAARSLAGELGLESPRTFNQIVDDPALVDAVVEWLADQTPAP